MSVPIISPSPTTKFVDEYDFRFTDGLSCQIFIDQTSGDSITFLPETINVVLAPKPHLTDRRVKTPVEDFTIRTSKLAYTRHRLLEVDVPTEAQQEELEQSIAAVCQYRYNPFKPYPRT